MSEIPDNAPAPRLCIIAKWSDFEGYGFNLHAEKSKPGQYIGKVDDNSPAEMAGLKEGDRIIEVNGVNIANENHKQVVQRIKTVPNETRLLVVDTATDQYYKGKNIVVKSSQPNVITKSSVREPAPPSPKVSDDPPPYSNGHDDAADTRSVSSAASSSVASEGSTLPQSPMSTSPTPPPSLDHTISKPAPSPTPTPTPTPVTSTTESVTTVSKNPPQPLAKTNSYNSGGLNLNMSAAEMRAVLARKKKVDPRKDTLDFRKKYEIIQNM